MHMFRAWSCLVVVKLRSIYTLTAQWCLKSPASRLFAQTFVQAEIKENTKAPRHWPLSPVTVGFLSQRASSAEKVFIWWRHHDTSFLKTALALQQSCEVTQNRDQSYTILPVICSRNFFSKVSTKIRHSYKLSHVEQFILLVSNTHKWIAVWIGKFIYTTGKKYGIFCISTIFCIFVECAGCLCTWNTFLRADITFGGVNMHLTAEWRAKIQKQLCLYFSQLDFG